MAELSTKNPFGTSFQGIKMIATIEFLESAIGCTNSYTKETGNDWVCETADGDVFTIYQWNNIGIPEKNEPVEWHIGAHSSYVALTAKDEITQLIKPL